MRALDMIGRLALAVALASLLMAAQGVTPIDAANCNGTSVGFLPLNDLGGGFYQGTMGGLYPGGTNVRPAAHESDGLAQAQLVTPRNASGAPDPNGSIVLVSIGMSNTTQEFSVFVPLANADPQKNPRLVIVDGAQGGQTADDWANATCSCWSTLTARLSAAGVTPAQVQAAWVKVAVPGPTLKFPADVNQLKGHMANIARHLKQKLPNIRLAYYSSRIYAGYAQVPLNPEPWAYQSGFAVKWLIEDQINGVGNLNFDPARGTVQAPWLAWGPYLWADGLVPRSDGLTYACSDFQNDGTHPATGARNKVAQLLHSFFRSDSTAQPWFLSGATLPPPPPPPPTTHQLLVSIAGSGAGSVTSSPPGIDCGLDCAHHYAAGQIVTLSPRAAAGSTFVGWGGDADCLDGVLTMSGDRSCAATFEPSLPLGPASGSIDFNGDRLADALTFDELTGAWSMEMGTQGHAFSHVNGSWSPGWQVQAAEFSGDGLTDLFLYHPSSGEWRKAISTGQGGFTFVSGFWSPGWQIHVLDLNGDRLSDVFVYDALAGAWFKCVSAASSGFSCHPRGSWSPGWSVMPVERTGDGFADLFLYNETSGQWFWAVNDGGAGFTYTADLWSPGWQIRTGDFDGDRRSDLFLYNAVSAQWFVATNGSGAFSYTSGFWSPGWSVSVADFDGNGRSDVFVYDETNGLWFECVTRPSGGFDYYGGSWSPGWQISVVDFESDGRSDLLLYNAVSGNWFQASNTALGAFAYTSGFWAAGVDVVATTTRVP